MSDQILLEVMTPERKVFSGRVTEVQFPSKHRGFYGILPDHTTVLTPVGDGVLTYSQGGQRQALTVFGGFADVGPTHVTLLARESESPDMLNPDQLKTQHQAALASLKAAKTPEDATQAQQDLDAVLIRLQALGIAPPQH